MHNVYFVIELRLFYVIKARRNYVKLEIGEKLEGKKMYFFDRNQRGRCCITFIFFSNSNYLYFNSRGVIDFRKLIDSCKLYKYKLV